VSLDQINARLARAMEFAELRGQFQAQTQAELPWLMYMTGHFVIAVDRREDAAALEREDFNTPWAREFWGKIKPLVSQLAVMRAVTYEGHVLELLKGVAHGETGDGRQVIQPVTGFRVLRAS
jgi:hypothetical protein